MHTNYPSESQWQPKGQLVGQKQPSLFLHLIVLVMCKLPEGKVYGGRNNPDGEFQFWLEKIFLKKKLLYLFILVKYSFRLPRWLSRKEPAANAGAAGDLGSVVWEASLEKEMATHSSVLAWEIPWTEEPSELQVMGSQRVGHDWATEHVHSCSTMLCQPLF